MSTVLAFEACEQLNCVELNIVDDLTVERSESFAVTLERTNDPAPMIEFNPMDAVIEIRDNDGERVEQKT